MKAREYMKTMLASSAMLALILDSATAIKGCRDGLALCVGSVIPALFPFLVLSPILTGALRFRLPQWLRRAMKLPENSDGLLIAGCLGGYPIGAQCIASAANSKQLSKEDAHRLMAFCCNCGPGFVFGICGSFFASGWAALSLWLCHIGAALLVGMLLPGKESFGKSYVPAKIGLTQAVTGAVKAMAQICGWVILFRCLLNFLQKWVLWRVKGPALALICGWLELTNGCFFLEAIPNEGLRLVICEMILSFGGVCVAMQTASVTEKNGLGLYLPGKLAQMAISSLLIWGVWKLQAGEYWKAFALIVALGAIFTAAKQFLGKRKNISRNLRAMGV